MDTMKLLWICQNWNHLVVLLIVMWIIVWELDEAEVNFILINVSYYDWWGNLVKNVAIYYNEHTLCCNIFNCPYLSENC